MSEVRVRYAPSPTGMQHIGGVRTALFNYLFARANGGKFILRLEDTDRTRYGEEYVQNLYDTLDWLHIEWDEGGPKGGEFGPYVQSERFDLYKEYAQKLIEKGEAYYCFCDSERLNRIRLIQQKNKMPPGYDRNCRHLTPEEVQENLDKGIPHVIRLKVPLEGVTKFRDALLGDIEWKNEDISPDPILLKSDGFPTYHLANIIDDHFMKITHVMRAQEWIPSTPLHVQLYRAFGWEPPVFCHLPMVNGNDGHKLSKRHGATSVNEFRARGYIPEALINYVGMLGCSYEDGRDMYTLSDMEKLFKIEHMNKAGAVFDYKKLEWFNGQYMRNFTDAQLVDNVLPFITGTGSAAIPINASDTFPAPKVGPEWSGIAYVDNDPKTGKLVLADQSMRKIVCGDENADTNVQDKAIREKLLEVAPLIKERLHFLTDAAEMVSFLFKTVKIPSVEQIIPKRLDKEKTKEVLEQAIKYIEAMPALDHEGQEQLARDTSKEMGIKMGDFMMPIRWAVTGSRVSPPLMGSIMILGTDIAINRVNAALAEF
ncbi:MAG: glutamate--tRNA ligase [Treponema sp. CETP13]|nr:MAG: glutamate--tRNA ligase [Treponema sp. CETP13]